MGVQVPGRADPWGLFPQAAVLEDEEEDKDFVEVPDKEGFEAHIPAHLRAEYGECSIGTSARMSSRAGNCDLPASCPNPHCGSLHHGALQTPHSQAGSGTQPWGGVRQVPPSSTLN